MCKCTSILFLHKFCLHLEYYFYNEIIMNNDEEVVLLNRGATKRERKRANLKRHWKSLLFVLPALIYVIIFCYVPMYGILIAFQDYMPGDPIVGSYTMWVGLDNFKRFFNLPNFSQIFLNTFVLCLFGFLVGFPIPIIVALMLNSLRGKNLKQIIQTIFYAPHFISLIVLVGMVFLFFGSNGLINRLFVKWGGDVYPYLLKPEAFRPLFILSGNWQDFGWSAIIYLAALAGVDPSLHEAAEIDGASRFRRVFSVDLPAIMPTVSMILILSIGNLMSCGYEKVLLMQTSGNLETSEIISSYVYKIGLISGEYSLSTAAGLFNSVVNVVLLVLANYASRKFSEYSMW